MIFYFDTSALLKRYVLEEGTQEVLAVFRREEGVVATSALTFLEGVHGICRKAKESKASEGMLRKVLKEFKKDLQHFKIVEYTSALIQSAQKIIQHHTLKTLDAIHIASALIFKRTNKLKVEFISCDDHQNRVAEYYSLKVFNPLHPHSK